VLKNSTGVAGCSKSSSFKAAREEEEAAISRLYGGIHFASDNNNGLLVGREVGRRVIEYAR
jgi:hypothetical protein